ncbi:MAG: hypothetical protein OXK82_10675 [Deltaproteobacteria bacterium]|nr:hypothetical protein [Deltaproteobacteria bacterium]
MTDAEEERIIGADFKAKRAAERRLSCLESKRAAMQENIELMSRAFDDDVVVDSFDGNILRTHDGKFEDRQHTPIVCPSAQDIFDLVKEIAATQSKIAEIERRLERV